MDGLFLKGWFIMAHSQELLSPMTLARAVDGALGREELKQLLQSCEQAPARWKQLAMAFLEERALQKDLSALRLEGTLFSGDEAASVAAIANDADETFQTPARRRRTWPVIRQVIATLSIAAALLMAFWVGRNGNTLSTAPSPSLAPSQVSENAETTQAPTTEFVNTELNPHAYPQLAGNMVVELAGKSGQSEQVVLPVIYANPAEQRQLAEWSSALPQELETQIRQTGYSISKRQNLVPVTLENGEHAVIPVAQYKLHQPIVE